MVVSKRREQEHVLLSVLLTEIITKQGHMCFRLVTVILGTVHLESNYKSALV